MYNLRTNCIDDWSHYLAIECETRNVWEKNRFQFNANPIVFSAITFQVSWVRSVNVDRLRAPDLFGIISTHLPGTFVSDYESESDKKMKDRSISQMSRSRHSLADVIHLHNNVWYGGKSRGEQMSNAFRFYKFNSFVTNSKRQNENMFSEIWPSLTEPNLFGIFSRATEIESTEMYFVFCFREHLNVGHANARGYVRQATEQYWFRTEDSN